MRPGRMRNGVELVRRSTAGRWSAWAARRDKSGLSSPADAAVGTAEERARATRGGLRHLRARDAGLLGFPSDPS